MVADDDDGNDGAFNFVSALLSDTDRFIGKGLINPSFGLLTFAFGCESESDFASAFANGDRVRFICRL